MNGIKIFRWQAIFAMFILVPTFLVPVVAMAASAGSSGVWLGARRTESKLLEVAVPYFETADAASAGMGATAAGIISADLKFSGFFKPYVNQSYMNKAARKEKGRFNIDYNEWKTMVSSFVIKGKIIPDGADKIALEIKVFDLQARKRIFAKRYKGSARILRKIVHTFSDEILFLLTGEKGIANTRIGFVSRVRGRKEIFISDYDGKRKKRITNDQSLILFPSWNPKADWILFTTYKYRNPDLYVIDLVSKKRWPVSRKIGLNSTGEWSPDGRSVVFSLSRRGNSEIYVAASDGTHARRLTNSYAIETSPTFSPDGKYIAYTSDRPGVPQIYVMRIDGSGKQRMTYVGRYNDGAAWSPRGDHIAYSSLTGRSFDIALVDARALETKRKRDTRRLTYGPGSNESPSFSPNGRHIAFTSVSRGVKQVSIINATGENKRQITFGSGGGSSATWGPAPFAESKNKKSQKPKRR